MILADNASDRKFTEIAREICEIPGGCLSSTERDKEGFRHGWRHWAPVART